MSSQNDPQYTVPGMTASEGGETIQLLRMRLHALNDLALTLKHVHWNVVGPHFIAVHEMLDPQVDAVRGMVDETAERISTLGGSPAGTPGALVKERDWDDYAVGRAEAMRHLGALDIVYAGIIADHRRAADAVGKLDPVSQDLLIQHLRGLEHFQWLIRAHLESAGGRLNTQGGTTEIDGAAAGEQALRRV
ncbi:MULTISPECIES: Dps family protein [unclassified Streptomyces]|uniref:Dps family protein n=1 Tax=unclassified Streptomyces TaxID=2593676 RepID=UPI00093BD9F0|nr:DNA starvation/stationary phase protection protein [Streptomyces sp. TSRI0281]OKI46869.1 DNA starvation/stationary phase protection protein [Streptomyces sp. TSRI0281]